jgi:hypothetical protein
MSPPYGCRNASKGHCGDAAVACRGSSEVAGRSLNREGAARWGLSPPFCLPSLNGCPVSSSRGRQPAGHSVGHQGSPPVLHRGFLLYKAAAVAHQRPMRRPAPKMSRPFQAKGASSVSFDGTVPAVPRDLSSGRKFARPPRGCAPSILRRGSHDRESVQLRPRPLALALQ